MNETSEAELASLGYGVAERAVISSLLILVIVLTVGGNVVVMLSVTLIRCMRTLSNAFVFSLAVADMLVGVCVMPWSVVVQWSNGVWLLGRPFCLIWLSWDVYFSTISIVHFSCLAVDRYLAICDPFRYPRVMTSKAVACLLLTCWILPGFISFLPILAGWNTLGIEEYVPSPEAPLCFLMVNMYFALICSFIAFYIPLAAILFSYWRIFVVARRQARKIHVLEAAGGADCHDAQRKSLTKIKRDMKAAKTLAIIVGAFSICYLPFFTMNVLDPFFNYSLDPTQGNKLWIGFTWLGYCNSMINPWIYYVSNKSFRAAFRKILGCSGRYGDDYEYYPPSVARSRHNGLISHHVDRETCNRRSEATSV